MRAPQDRILGAWPDLGVTTAKDLLVEIRNQLFRAFKEERLETAQHGIQKWVRLTNGPGDDAEIEGGVKDFSRAPSSAHLVRDDGAWLHFTIRVRPDKRQIQLVAYDFEIVFPEGHVPPFVRIDLNPPDHANEAREIRSHIHPGNDDFQCPAPVLAPQEILDWMLGPLLRPRDSEKPRT